MSPTDVVARRVELSNAGDADGLAALYRGDVINHQVPETAVEGRAAIREIVRRESRATPSHDGASNARVAPPP